MLQRKENATAVKKENLESLFESRRKSLIKKLKSEALLIAAAPVVRRPPDLEHSYFQDANFFYLTGFEEPESLLLLLGSSSGPRSVLFVRDREPTSERWLGERLGVKRAKKKFRVDEVRDIKEYETALPKLLSQSRILHYAPGTHSDVDQFIWKLFSSSGPRTSFPHTLKDARLLLSELRFIKDRYEIRALKHVVDITANAFLEVAPRLKHISSEAHAARVIEECFSQFGASGPSFPTIVASGKNATCLHHTPRLQPLWKRELVLIDAGALFRGYAADMTRVFPVSGKFSKAQGDIYQIVYGALQAAISKAKPESTLEVLHQAAVKELTQGLLSLKALKGGDLAHHISSGHYKKFYMHRTGHFLGLDVHDIPPNYHEETDSVLSHYERPLVPGAVITIEPGLYFDVKDEKIPKHLRGIGIRLEEDILITNNGCEVLSRKMPITKDDIEHLMAS